MQLNLSQTITLGPEKVCLLEGGFKISASANYTYEREIRKIVQESSVKAIAVFGYKADLEKV